MVGPEELIIALRQDLADQAARDAEETFGPMPTPRAFRPHTPMEESWQTPPSRFGEEHAPREQVILGERQTQRPPSERRRAQIAMGDSI